MSIRIHKLAEELGLECRTLLVLLKERKIVAPDVRSVSSTVDNANASGLRAEFRISEKEQQAQPRLSSPTLQKSASKNQSQLPTSESKTSKHVKSSKGRASRGLSRDIERERQKVAYARYVRAQRDSMSD
jgi:hypothetical protein